MGKAIHKAKREEYQKKHDLLRRILKDSKVHKNIGNNYGELFYQLISENLLESYECEDYNVFYKLTSEGKKAVDMGYPQYAIAKEEAEKRRKAIEGFEYKIKRHWWVPLFLSVVSLVVSIFK